MLRVAFCCTFDCTAISHLYTNIFVTPTCIGLIVQIFLRAANVNDSLVAPSLQTFDAYVLMNGTLLGLIIDHNTTAPPFSGKVI